MGEIAALLTDLWSLIPAYLAWWAAFVDPGEDDAIPAHDPAHNNLHP